MLTKKPSATRTRLRFLLILPLMSLSVWCCTKNRPSVGIRIEGDRVTRTDAALQLPTTVPDTVKLISPNETGPIDTVIVVKDIIPSKLDGQPITTRDNLKTPPRCLNPGDDFGIKYLLRSSGAEGELEKAGDGEWNVDVKNLIVDPAGKVASCAISFSIVISQNGPVPDDINQSTKQNVRRRIAEQLIAGGIAFTVAKDATGKAIPYYLDRPDGPNEYNLGTSFVVKDHKLRYE